MSKHKTAYTTQAHPTRYAGVLFRSRLEATWAAFFDNIEWAWKYEPLDLPGWTPDFSVEFPCTHSECSNTWLDGRGKRDGSHILMVEVKPYFSVEQFKGHPCLRYDYGCHDEYGLVPFCGGAAFGIHPDVSYFAISHGGGGGEYCIKYWENYDRDIDSEWLDAAEKTRWRGDSLRSTKRQFVRRR